MGLRTRHQTRAVTSLLVFAPVLGVLFVTGVIGLRTSVAPYELISDPVSITDSPFYIGAVTNLGVLMWWSTATICVFSYAVATRLSPERREVRFLLWIGIFTAVLGLDDMFLLHERVAPVYFGIPETAVYAIYACIATLLVLHYWRSILRHDYELLLVAVIFFVCSQFVDVARGWGMDFYGVGFVEEAFKLLGIAGWLGFFALLSGKHLAGEAAASGRSATADTRADRAATPRGAYPTHPASTARVARRQ